MGHHGVEWVKVILFSAIALLLASSPAAASGKADPALLTVDKIFHEGAFESKPLVPIQWLKGTGFYTTVEPSPTIANGQDILRHDPASGTSTVLVSAEQLTPQGGKPIAVKGYQWSDDSRYLLIHTNTVAFRRYEPLGDYWVLDLNSQRLWQIGAGRPASSLMYAKFSPDSTRIAYWFANNIFVESLADGGTVALTDDGSDLIVNGTGDWVNEEEFNLRDGFKWSPDSRQIAYWQFDTEGVGTFFMMDNISDVYARPIPLQYPKVGTTNSAVRVGVVNAAGGKTTWAQLKGDPRQNYIPRMGWADEEELLVQYVNRLQNRVDVMLVDAASGQASQVFTETDAAWIDIHDDPIWLEGQSQFSWLSDRDGWRRLYRIDRASGTAVAITPARTDVIKLVHIDPAGGWAYYIASPEDNSARYLYRSALSGDASAERLTPAGPYTTHAYNVSPDARWAIHTASRFTQPPQIAMISLPDHAQRRVIVDNAEIRARLAQTPRGEVEFFKVAIADGTQLDGWMMFPPDFDANRKYPLLMFVYGEPAGQTVLNEWPRNSRYAYHLMLTQKGYIVASIDNRGTPAPRGRDWRKSISGKIGILNAADQAAAVRALLATRPYLDPARVGSWGWSGGGQSTLHALFQYPDLYRTGIAVAYVADQRLYDTIYQERYMGLPDSNPQGYEQGSPITHAGRLSGNLLLVHGTADDNVHYQSTEILVNRLIELDKDFSVMMYPGRGHGLKEGSNTYRHLYRTMTAFLEEHLPAGDDPENPSQPAAGGDQ